MLSGDKAFDLELAIRPVLFVPPSMKVSDLLLKMRLSGEHMAIVVDEYGGTDGLLTMEDLFEQIVGAIQDEHDEDNPESDISWISENVFEADARVKIDKLEEELGLDLSIASEGDFDTLGGMIFSYLGRVPAKGEVISYPSGFKIEILDADPRRIKRVRLTRAQETHPASSAG